MQGIKIMDRGYGFLISKQGTVVTYPDICKIMNESIFSMAEETNDAGLREIGRKMIQGKSAFISYKCRIFGHEELDVLHAAGFHRLVAGRGVSGT